MIIATAGHVDHGKTALVKALTNVDTDRLPEEKRRGLTIDLGFAYQAIGDRVLGFIDVPGHERFLRNMVAGVHSIDFALLVVAADDGPMPQTYEHLAILHLLGVCRGAVTITKIDKVEAARLAIVQEEIRAAIRGSGLADVPFFAISAHRGDGLALLREFLRDSATALPPRPEAGHFRLSIDRRFTVAGAGLVVTGTAISGRISIGDHVTLSPQGLPARVRGIHAYDRPSKIAHAGQRCALNIAAVGGVSLTKSDIQRGDWIVAEEAHAPTQHVDCRVHVLPSEARPLKHWTPVHVHIGAADVPGRLAVLGGQQIEPGGNGLAHVVFDRSVIAVHGDRLILRDQSASRTIGGGIILDPFAPSRSRNRPERRSLLTAMEQESAAAALQELLSHEASGVDLEWFCRAWNMTVQEAAELYEHNPMITIGAKAGRFGFLESHWKALTAAVVETLKRYHIQHLEQLGVTAGELLRTLPLKIPQVVLNAALGQLIEEQAVRRRGTLLHLSSHAPIPTPREAALWRQVEPRLQAKGLRPPRVRELATELGMAPEEVERFLQRASELGLVIRAAHNRFFLPEMIMHLAEIAEVLAADAPSGEFETATFRDRSGIGRNLTIEVLEYFDKAGLTQRAGSRRRLRAPAHVVFA